MPRELFAPSGPKVFASALALALLGLVASAQYPSGYSYPKPTARPPAYKAPNMAGGLSTFGGNPYKSQFYPPTGTATGAKHGFGSLPTTTGNPFAHQPIKKPFSKSPVHRPLVSSMDAARISVVSGLWDGPWLGY